MVFFNEVEVKEIQSIKHIFVRCKKCHRNFGYLADFKNFCHRFWSVLIIDLDWDLVINEDGQNYSCTCGVKIGSIRNNSTLIICKSDVEVFY